MNYFIIKQTPEGNFVYQIGTNVEGMYEMADKRWFAQQNRVLAWLRKHGLHEDIATVLASEITTFTRDMPVNLITEDQLINFEPYELVPSTINDERWIMQQAVPQRQLNEIRNKSAQERAAEILQPLVAELKKLNVHQLQDIFMELERTETPLHNLLSNGDPTEEFIYKIFELRTEQVKLVLDITDNMTELSDVQKKLADLSQSILTKQ
jgi:hypothetical protein